MMIKNSWYAILPSKKIKKGQILGVVRLSLELAIFRTTTGELGCVKDKCTHRGAALSHGSLKGDCLACPFHGIEFTTEGKCHFIPANGISSKEDLKRYNVEEYLVKEEHGIIYFWYGEKSLATKELPFFTESIDESYVYSEMEDTWATHYSRVIENQLDVVHVPIVHYNTIGRGNKTLVNGPKSEYVNGILRTSAFNEQDHGQTPKKSSECSINDKMNLSFIFPNIWMNYIADKIKVLIYFVPVNEEETILYIRFYCKVTKIRFVNAIVAWFGKFANRIIERQDKRVVITEQPKASSYLSDEKLLRGDGPIILYRKIRAQLQEEAKEL